MTDYEAAIAKARGRIEECVADMDEAEAAKLLLSVEPAVFRFANRKIGDSTPYAAGTPEHAAYHAAVGPGIDLPIEQQASYSRQAAILMTVIAREREEIGATVDDFVTSSARSIARGSRLSVRFSMRLLRRVRTELLDMLKPETDGARIAVAMASFVGTVRVADVAPEEAARFVKETLVETAHPEMRADPKATYAAMDETTRKWLSNQVVTA
jgi:hypothetical protein